jgi:hypothetical protein
MFFKPSILALFLGSLLTSGMILACGVYGWQIVRHWDLQSGSELQLRLEKRTYLISTLMSYAFTYQLLSFFLFIYTADYLHTYFVGAMCAAGSLNANEWGYPVIMAKMVNFMLAGLWLILNYTDNQAYDYPLIRKKYLFLLAIIPFILAETFFLTSYFLGLHPEIITSCCGALFTPEGKGVASEIILSPRLSSEIAFYATMAGTLILGGIFFRTGHGGYWFSLLAVISFFLSIIAFISFISIYFYELPTHHCPFCVLQREYGFIGYPIYLALMGGGLLGAGVGILMPFRKIESLKAVLPAIQKKLAIMSVISYASFTGLVVYEVFFSNLKMF